MQITFDQNAVQDQVIANTSNALTEEFLSREDIERRISALFEETVKKKCEEIALSSAEEFIQKGIEDFVIQVTNQFGEEKGEPVTFTEYVTALAENYLNDEVDINGNPCSRHDRSKKTRLCFLLERHLHFRIETSMKDAVKMVIEQVAPAIATTCELKIREATADIRRAMGK